MITHTAIVLCFIFSNALLHRICSLEERHLEYSRVKLCHKSNGIVISSAQVDSLQKCSELANQKKGFAFNFSPPEGKRYLHTLKKNCEILDCPEIGEKGTLVADLAFDYYSAYGNSNVTDNATCIKSIGLFIVVNEKQTYLDSISKCQNIGGDLPDVTSEIRTKYLSKIINSSLEMWYKVAYIGLDDYESHKKFSTVSGSPLGCFRYRAWAPGHPRFDSSGKNCVVLDTERMWRVVGCHRKLPSVCQLFPDTFAKDVDFSYINCVKLSNRTELKDCQTKASLWNMAKNSSRVVQCGIVNDVMNIREDNKVDQNNSSLV